MTVATYAPPTLLAETFRAYARGAMGTAHKEHARNDSYGQLLAEARASIYEACAELVETMPLAEAAELMMRKAGRCHVVGLPFGVNFDAVGVEYIRARAWQFCAWRIDPTLPEVQPKI